MNLCFDQSLGLGYKSNSQKIRVMSESWVNDNIFARYVEMLEFQNWKITALLQTFSVHPVGKSLS